MDGGCAPPWVVYCVVILSFAHVYRMAIYVNQKRRLTPASGKSTTVIHSLRRARTSPLQMNAIKV